MISLTTKGDFSKSMKYLEKLMNITKRSPFDKYGEMGVKALKSMTPVDTGKTAASWDYVVKRERDSTTIVWTNSNVNQNVNVAVLIQMGHGTGYGSYVRGVDYINPALKPIFEQIATELRKEVSSE